eukprot:15467217-Alexandrium_andersonii.AAC.1
MMKNRLRAPWGFQRVSATTTHCNQDGVIRAPGSLIYFPAYAEQCRHGGSAEHRNAPGSPRGLVGTFSPNVICLQGQAATRCSIARSCSTNH